MLYTDGKRIASDTDLWELNIAVELLGQEQVTPEAYCLQPYYCVTQRKAKLLSKTVLRKVEEAELDRIIDEQKAQVQR